MHDVSISCRLYCTSAGISSIPHIPSAAGWNSTNGTTSDTDPKHNHTPEDPNSLPPLEDLFGEFQEGDEYIDRLEELAESLLREVTSEVETNSTPSNEQVKLSLIILNKMKNNKFSSPIIRL